MSGPARRLVGRRAAPPSLLLAGAAAFFALAAAPPAPPELPESPLAAFAIPAFARMYRTSCSTCHTAAPKLNVLGEAFRLNGYRFPENDRLLRRDSAVVLGGEAWKDLWPRAIWPGEIPGAVPLAFRVANDLVVRRGSDQGVAVRLRFPDEVYLLAGTSLGDNIAIFLESEWSREEGVEVLQAKVEFQNLLPWLPKRTLNLWAGVQNPYLFTFADRQIDRAARLKFLWQEYSVSDIELVNPVDGDSLVSPGDFELGETRPAVELNGLVQGRLYYGVGVAQKLAALADEEFNRIDFYYKLRYKFGGLSLDGRYAPGRGPVLGGGGQLLDRSVTLEHFGYFGAQPVEGGQADDHRSFGFNVRGLYGPLDLGAGYVWGKNDNPWGDVAVGSVPFSSFFAKVEYLFYPWLIGSLKFDTFDAEIPASVRETGFASGDFEATRILPGVVFLIRQNVRGVIEADLFTDSQMTADPDASKPRSLFFRLDVAF